jgi:hypothetical protein
MQHNNFRGSAECFRGLKKKFCGSNVDFWPVINVCGSIINVCGCIINVCGCIINVSGTTINVRALREMFAVLK